MSRELLIVSWFVGSFDTLAVVESRADPERPARVR